MAAERTTFVNRFFGGALNQLMVSFLDQKDFTEDDLDELQKILDKKRNDLRR